MNFYLGGAAHVSGAVLKFGLLLLQFFEFRADYAGAVVAIKNEGYATLDLPVYSRKVSCDGTVRLALSGLQTGELFVETFCECINQILVCQQDVL